MSLTYIRIYKNTDKNIMKVSPKQSELIFYTETHSIRNKVNQNRPAPLPQKKIVGLPQ